MNGETDELSFCSACQSPMDVTMLPPFTNVQCPECGAHTRIKMDLGPYTLNKRVGAGGMSLVFRAMDKNLGRQVAIKILNEEYSMDQYRIEQFEQEAKITAAISHPHCVRMYTVGQAFRRFYIAMELVAGGSLEELMSHEGAVSEEKMLPVAMQVNEGLDAAYQAGLIHRDIKPGNILFDADGHVKIVDFGLALVTQGGAAKADEIWATPYYVSPETLDNLEEDFRSDMYALGATLYHALSGKPPFETETRSTNELKEIKKTLPSLRVVAPWLSEETCSAVDRAMAFAPADRFRSYDGMFSAFEMAESLVRTRGSKPLVEDSGQESSPERVWRKWMAPGIVALGLIAIGGIGLAMRGSDASKGGADNDELSSISLGGELDQELWVKIGKDYVAAQNLLKRGKYSAAGNHFAKLMRDEQVVEPTASLASLQASISYLLDGRSWDAIKHLREKTSRDLKNEKRDDLDTVLSGRIKQGIGKLIKIEPVQPNEVGHQLDQVGFILTFASALKNWNQGCWEESIHLFERVKKTSLNDDIRDLSYYKGIGQVYLSEYKRLKPYLKGMDPKSLEDVRKMRRKVDEVAKKLETKGRSELQIRIWKEQLDRYEAQFNYEAKEKLAVRVKKEEESTKGDVTEGGEEGGANNFEDLRSDVNNFIEIRDFRKAVRLLVGRDFEVKDRKLWKRQMIYLSNGAAGFIQSIEKNTEGEGFSFRGETVDDVVFERVEESSPKGIVIEQDGARQFMAWHELTNETMLALYSVTRGDDTSEEQELARLEGAISFALLVGEVDRAKLAAENLISQLEGEERDVFEARWNPIVERFANEVEK